jgi:hypothetical protein
MIQAIKSTPELLCILHQTQQIYRHSILHVIYFYLTINTN